MHTTEHKRIIDLEKTDCYAVINDAEIPNQVSYKPLGSLSGVGYASLRVYGYYRESCFLLVTPCCNLPIKR
jgi:hypothetical protein